MAMEDGQSRRELPLLAQLLIQGSSNDQKSKENKSLAHDSGSGAACRICGPECSGLDLHFWRKVCRNCGCRPEQHNIKINETVHQGIVKNLFAANDGKRTLSGSGDDLGEEDDTREIPENGAKQMDKVVPTIRIESMTLDPENPEDNEVIPRDKPRVPDTGKHEKSKTIPRRSPVDVTAPSSKMNNKQNEEVRNKTPRAPAIPKSVQNRPNASNASSAPNVPSVPNTTGVPNMPIVPMMSSVPKMSKVPITVKENADPKQAEEEGRTPVPPKRRESYEGVERQRKLLSQLPPQDFDPKFCSTLNRKHKQAMNKMVDIKKQAAGKGKLAGNDKQRICRGCNTEIGQGQKGVCSTYEKQLVYWHPECFKCNSCNETIADFIYFWHENNIYCGRHFAEKFRPRCAGCDELIYAEKYTKAEGQSWHMEHFTCFKCDKSLADTNYISHKGQPHCMTCYHYKIASKCASCGLPIQVGEERISHGNMHWHAYQECFFCRGCNKNLVDVGFLLLDHKLYCSTKCSNAR